MENAVDLLVVNLQEQQILYQQLLHFTQERLLLLQSAQEETDLEPISVSFAQEQNLIERIDGLNEKVQALRLEIAKKLPQKPFGLSALAQLLPFPEQNKLSQVLAVLTDLMQELKETNQAGEVQIERIRVLVGSRVKSYQDSEKTTQAYEQGGGFYPHMEMQESRFIDFKK